MDNQTPGLLTDPTRRPSAPVVLIFVLVFGLIAWFWAREAMEQQNEATGFGANDVPAADVWTRSPNFTTCSQWQGQMTDAQREAMAGQLLPILRRQVDTAASDGIELIPAFVQAIDAACRMPEVAADPEYVITAAATLAFLDGTRFQP